MNSMIRQWNGKKIHIRPDRYVSATDMTKATQRRFVEFLELKNTQEYLRVLSKRCNIPIDKNDCKVENPTSATTKATPKIQNRLIEVVYNGKIRHTYFYPKLALRFAQWCSAEFAVEVDFWLDDIFQGKTSKTLPLGIDPSRFQLYRPLEDGKAKWEKIFFSLSQKHPPKVPQKLHISLHDRTRVSSVSI